MNTLPASYDAWRLTPQDFDEPEIFEEPTMGQKLYLELSKETGPLLDAWAGEIVIHAEGFGQVAVKEWEVIDGKLVITTEE